MSAVQSGPNSETISWTTAVPSDSRVYYRPSGKVYVLASNPQLTTSHAIVLTGLTAGVSYQYYVSSTDSATLPVTSGSSNYFTLSAFSWSATPTTLGFPGSPIVNATSAIQTVSINNPNPFGLKLGSISVSGPFAITSNFCVATSTWDGTIAPNSHCNLTVAFKPTATGLQGGMLTLIALGTTKIVSLSGNGVAALTLTGPASVDVACDHAVTAQFKAAGGQPPYKFGVVPPGVLPVGVQVSMNSNGLLSILWPCSVTVNGIPLDNRRQVLIAMGTKFIIHR